MGSKWSEWSGGGCFTLSLVGMKIHKGFKTCNWCLLSFYCSDCSVGQWYFNSRCFTLEFFLFHGMKMYKWCKRTFMQHYFSNQTQQHYTAETRHYQCCTV